MRYEWFIGLRYLRAKRKQTIISVITLISIFGVILGVAALIIVLAVMTGFEIELRDKILGTNAHIMVLQSDPAAVLEDEAGVLATIKSVEGVTGAAPFLYSKILIGRGNRNDGILIKGVDPGTVTEVSELADYMTDGTLESLATDDPREPGIILGEEVAKSLGARLHDVVRVMIPAGTLTPGGMMPRLRSFRVTGIFTSGMYEYDSSLAYINIETARGLFRMGGATSGIEVRVEDIFKVRAVTDAIQHRIGFKYWVRDWIEMNRSFFSALKLEKVAMFVILVLIVVVAAFNIIGTLTMMVMEKNKDIGILNAMGATPRGIMWIFMVQGMVIGVVGTVIGSILGIVVCYVADTYKLIRLQGDVYYFSYLPFDVQVSDVLLICAASLLISFVATLFPSSQAAKLDPVEAIRYE
ncbi:lipoprotein-releasing ABC transporter permease subunit [bacterium]|nr:lipoprotein-releasing ABC transporter permease subunit [candidate division CSSED10-310 bacterium]